MKSSNDISETELRRLLHDLKDRGMAIGIRFRMLGEMWQNSHHRVIRVSENGVVLHNEAANKIIILPDLKNVMQFELDGNFQNYQPHFHYSVVIQEKSQVLK